VSGIWQVRQGEPLTTEPSTTRGTETFIVLEGSATLLFGDGSRVSIEQGDVVTLPDGAVAVWHVDAHHDFRKFYVTVPQR